MIDDRRIESARRTAMATLILSVVVIPTAIYAAASDAELAVWLLCLEALGIATTSLLIRADLRPDQRHTVR